MPFTVYSHTTDFTDDIIEIMLGRLNGTGNEPDFCKCFKGPPHLTQVNQINSSEPIGDHWPFQQITFHDPNDPNGRIFYLVFKDIQKPLTCMKIL